MEANVETTSQVKKPSLLGIMTSPVRQFERMRETCDLAADVHRAGVIRLFSLLGLPGIESISWFEYQSWYGSDQQGFSNAHIFCSQRFSIMADL